MDKLVLMIVFLTPLSITFREMLDKRVGTDLSMPTEPLLVGVLLLFIIKLIHGYRMDSKILRHPISVIILIDLAWIAFTSITSTMPMISLKFLISRLWFVVPIYFIGIELFKERKNIKRFIWLYIVPLTLVIFYTIYVHSKFEFAERPANWVVKPFYNDHTAYGAMLAMFIPALVGFMFIRKNSATTKIIAILLFCIFIIATVLSFTRAAWVSLAGALLILLILWLRIQFRTLLIIAGVALGVFFLYQDTIIAKLEENNQDASDNFTEHIQSISNISTDASNKERLNRWSCAIRMFKSKPIIGYGPGTYSFQYGPFQLNRDKTIISTKFGDGGNAHSEYLGPLAESGIIGSLCFIILAGLVLATGMRVYYSLEDKELKVLTCVILLGLITYFIHGFMNNFLDTDKASVPFWGFVGMLTAIDIYHTNKKEERELLKPTAE